MKTTPVLRALALVLTLTATALHAQVPQILNYQGRVAVGDPPVNFDGSGAFKFALVQGEGPTLLWKNDGSAGNTEPATAVTLPVTKGLYSVLLGANMTAIPATVFANPDVRLRVWFNDGVNGVQLLSPDQRIAAVGYAMVASTLQSGATISSSTAAPAASIANSTDNPAALKLSALYRTWWVGQNKAPDALTTFDQFYIYDQNANATRLRIDTTGVIHGNGSGLTGVAASGLAPGATIPASALTGTITGGQLASDLTLSGTTSGTFIGDGSGLTNLPASATTGPIHAATPQANMVWIKEGSFAMGSPSFEVGRSNDEGPQTSVTISRGFWMGIYEVTQAQYQAVMGDNPSSFTGDTNRPVETVSWNDAVAYCAALTTSERAAGRCPATWSYRLPTEAEWEYACRAGTPTRFSYGDDPGYTLLTNYAWYSSNSGSTTHPVGQKAPNPWGLYDMHGNVFEWCQDSWDGTANYPGGSTIDPLVTSGSDRVLRGGGWGLSANAARCADRNGYGPDDASDYGVGFRAVLAPGQ